RPHARRKPHRTRLGPRPTRRRPTARRCPTHYPTHPRPPATQRPPLTPPTPPRPLPFRPVPLGPRGPPGLPHPPPRPRRGGPSPHQARPAPTIEYDAEDKLVDDKEHLDPQARDAAAVTTASFGVHANRPLRLPDLPTLGVGLTGPGAHHAARGVLAAALSAGG